MLASVPIDRVHQACSWTHPRPSCAAQPCPHRTMITLSDNRWLRFGAFAGLYAAQGLPFGTFTVALPTWLASEGFSTSDVGFFIAVVSFPWAMKLLAGPVMDRFAFLPMGRRRPWVIGAQIGMLLGAIGLAGGDTSYSWMLTFGFIINFCAAWQDVAVDGMAIDVLPEDERAKANAFMFGGQAFGTAASAAGGAWLLANYGLVAASLMMALSVGMIVLIPLCFRERQGERLLPWTAGETLARSTSLQDHDMTRIVRNLLVALVMPMSLLLILVKFGDRVAVGVLGAAWPVLTTQELGLSSQFYPEWNAVAGVAAAVFGVLVAPLIDRVRAERALVWGLGIKAGIVLCGGLLVEYWVNEQFLIALIFSISFSGQLLTIASIALFMNLCVPKIAATQFAVYMALSNLALSAGSAMIGTLDDLFEFHEIFVAVAILDGLMMVTLLRFNLNRHKAQIEAKFAAA